MRERKTFMYELCCRSKFISYVGDFYITKREEENALFTYEVRKRTREKSLGLKEKW